MTGFLKRLFGGEGMSSPCRGAALIAELARYPANSPPFPGKKRSLTDAELDANLAHLVATASVRLAVLGALLGRFEVDISPLLDAALDAAPAAAAVDAWLSNELPDPGDMPPSDPANAPLALFEESNRSGPQILFTLAADLGLLEGEAIRRRDPRFAWAVNRERSQRTLQACKRPCLMKAGAPDWAANAIDFELTTLAILYERRRGTGVLHRFGDHLADAARGAFDPSPTGRY